MEYLAVIIVSALTTTCILCCASGVYFVKRVQMHESKAKKIAEDLAVAHNANQETIEKLIGQVNDLKTQIAMTRQGIRNKI